ncbi:MAG: hypothetical protein ABIR47_14620 [Candidatus Kapaibacterium sp.]
MNDDIADLRAVDEALTPPTVILLHLHQEGDHARPLRTRDLYDEAFQRGEVGSLTTYDEGEEI